MSVKSSVSDYSGAEKPRLSETRSIDYIPLRERHGHSFSQFTLWFGGNLQITAIVTGALAVVLGGDVIWSLIGLLEDRFWAQRSCRCMRSRVRVLGCRR